MTEINKRANDLAPSVERFILHWGDLGSQWGVSRSVAQIHALLYLSEKPLTAEEIADSLGLARSNVSTSIKELLGWRLIRRVPVLGDRRDHFEAEVDIWEMLTRIAQGRKEREIDPAAEALKACVASADSDQQISPVARERLHEMLEFVETLDRWYSQMLNVPSATLMKLVKMGSRVVNIVSLGRRRDKDVPQA
jgi:DNA-binding transcriptional regulator GbsR (MarR family)